MYVPFLETEQDRIEGWRLHVLLEADYPQTIAEHLAKGFTVDLHKAVDLLKRGCPPDLAREILT